jgi:hypothetical protein
MFSVVWLVQGVLGHGRWSQHTPCTLADPFKLPSWWECRAVDGTQDLLRMKSVVAAVPGQKGVRRSRSWQQRSTGPAWCQVAGLEVGDSAFTPVLEGAVTLGMFLTALGTRSAALEATDTPPTPPSRLLLRSWDGCTFSERQRDENVSGVLDKVQASPCGHAQGPLGGCRVGVEGWQCCSGAPRILLVSGAVLAQEWLCVPGASTSATWSWAAGRQTQAHRRH